MHGCSPSSPLSEGTSIPLNLGPVSFGNLMPQALWVFGGFRFFYYVHLSWSYVSDPSLHKLSQFMQLAMPPRLGLRFLVTLTVDFHLPMLLEWRVNDYFVTIPMHCFNHFFIQIILLFLRAIVVPIKIYIYNKSCIVICIALYITHSYKHLQQDFMLLCN